MTAMGRLQSVIEPSLGLPFVTRHFALGHASQRIPKPHQLPTGPFVDGPALGFKWSNFVFDEHLAGLAGVAETTDVVGGAIERTTDWRHTAMARHP